MLVKAKLSQPYPLPYCTQIIDQKILKMTLTSINREKIKKITYIWSSMMIIWNKKIHIKVIPQKVSQGQTKPVVSFTILHTNNR